MSIEIYPEMPEYISYSAFSSWLQCGKAYELGRLVGVKETPSWWLAGGSAVHAATERYDRALWEERNQ